MSRRCARSAPEIGTIQAVVGVHVRERRSCGMGRPRPSSGRRKYQALVVRGRGAASSRSAVANEQTAGRARFASSPTVLRVTAMVDARRTGVEDALNSLAPKTGAGILPITHCALFVRRLTFKHSHASDCEQ